VSADPTNGADEQPAEEQPATEQPAGQTQAGSRQPTEEELRAAYEAELSRITSTDMIAQSAVSLLNLGARRLGLVGERQPGQAGGAAGETAPAGRDLEQVRDAIDAVRSLLEILERRIPEELRSLRDALAQLQMAYAREAQAGGEGAPSGSGGGQAPPTGAQEQPGEGGPGPAQSSGRLWVPGQ
jgi:hypothetical protein